MFLKFRNMKKIIFILIIFILINGCNNNSNNIDKKLAKCISEKSVIYISAGCVACAKQRELFGENFDELNVVDCAMEPEKCRDADIIVVPTWIINDNIYKGVQKIEELKELTGC